MNKKHLLAITFFAIYFLLGLITLKDYNISWDEPTHFKRGQAYLWYFLTGKKTYEGLPQYNLVEARKNPRYHERSLYQENGFDTNYHLIKDGDHPPLNDILAAFSNYVFYQKLGIMGDVESYHLFEIFVSAILVGVVFLFASEAFNLWTGVFSAIFLATYPLFWAESHFNVKDPIETVFFSVGIYFIWKSLVKKKIGFLLVSSLFVGMAFATKLNVIFMPFVLAPWLLGTVFFDKDLRKFIISKKFILTLGLIPVIAYGIFVISWPWLQQDVIGNTLRVLNYYKDIGTEMRSWNLYAAQWIFYSTPLIILPFFFAAIFLWPKIKGRAYAFALMFFWFSLTVLRVSIPGTSIYGGVRQIMEYIPPLAIIAGAGAGYCVSKIKYEELKMVFLLLTFYFLLLPIVRLHPNENVYLNKFTGGVRGAVEKGFPSAGFSFGNAYLQGLTWINKNVEREAKLALVQGTVLNIPAYKIRPDINYSNGHWSGIERRGEYLIELTYNYELKFFPYAWEYVEKMLQPVYQVMADGTPVLTVWKNDFEHTKSEFQKKETLYLGKFDLKVKDSSLVIDLPQEVTLSRVVVDFQPDGTCSLPKGGFVETSVLDEKWVREKDPISDEQVSGVKSIEERRLNYYFAARKAKNIRFTFGDKNSCVFVDSKPVIFVLE